MWSCLANLVDESLQHQAYLFIESSRANHELDMLAPDACAPVTVSDVRRAFATSMFDEGELAKISVTLVDWKTLIIKEFPIAHRAPESRKGPRLNMQILRPMRALDVLRSQHVVRLVNELNATFDIHRFLVRRLAWRWWVDLECFFLGLPVRRDPATT